MRFVLAPDPKDDDAWIALRWIAADVGEVKVERDQRSPLTENDISQARVRRAAQLLRADRDSVVPSVAKNPRNFVGKILV